MMHISTIHRTHSPPQQHVSTFIVPFFCCCSRTANITSKPTTTFIRHQGEDIVAMQGHQNVRYCLSLSLSLYIYIFALTRGGREHHQGSTLFNGDSTYEHILLSTCVEFFLLMLVYIYICGFRMNKFKHTHMGLMFALSLNINHPSQFSPLVITDVGLGEGRDGYLLRVTLLPRRHRKHKSYRKNTLHIHFQVIRTHSFTYNFRIPKNVNKTKNIY